MSVKRNLFSRLTRTRLLFPLLLIVLLLPALYWYTTRPKETAAWWNESWIYRKRIDISNPGGSDLTDFQISFTLDTTDTNKFQSNCEDLRITGVDGNLLPFWIEENNPGCGDANTKVWVKLPSIPSSGTYIYAYYGNPSASVSSDHDGEKVFEFFDDFENLSKWNSPSCGSISIVNSSLQWTASSSTGHCYLSPVSNINLTDQIVESRTRYLSGASGIVYWGVDARFNGTSSRYVSAFYNNNGTAIRRDSSQLTIGGDTSFTADTWYHNKLVASGTTLTAFRDHSQQATISNSSYTSGGTGLDFYSSGSVSYQYDYLTVRKHTATEPTTSTQSEETGPGPIAYWKFDEGTGTTVNDSSSNAHHGTITGATWQNEDQCVSGKCLYFDGTNDLVNTNFDYSMTYNKGTTFSLWFKPTTVDTGGKVKNLISKNEYEYMIAQLDAGLRIIQWDPGGINAIQFYIDSILTANQWHHLSFVYDGSQETSHVYLNGELINSQANIQTSFIDRTETTKIGWGYGWSSSPTPYFNGFIDEVRIFPYARTATQILQDYNQYSSSIGGGINTLSDGLVGYWKFDENTGTTVYNSAGNYMNLSILHDPDVNPNGPWDTGKYGSAFLSAGYAYPDYEKAGTEWTASAQTNFTVSVWFKPQTPPTTSAGYIISRWWGSCNETYQPGWAIEYNPTTQKINMLMAADSCGPDGTLTTNSTFNVDTWYHLVAVHEDGEQIRLYVNGALDNQTTYTLGLNPTPPRLSIGCGANNGSCAYAGLTDEVRIYNRVLSSSEIEQLYNFAPNPQLYYNFDEGTGSSVNDISGNGNNGTWSGSGSHWSTGKYGGAASFNGTNDVISSSLNTNSLYDISTFELWFKPSTISKKGLISGYPSADPIANRWDIQLSRLGGTDAGWVSHQGGGYISTTTPIQAEVWHHLAIIHDYTNNSTKIYLNGNLEQTGTAPYPTNTSINLLIGNGDGGYYHGLIDEVKIYNYARTEEQIRQDMAGTANPGINSSNILPQPVSHWSFDEQTGQTAYDKISNKNGTLGANTSFGSDDPTWKTQSSCKTNGCLSFDGDDRISLGSISESSTSHTFTMWVKSSTTPSGLKYLFDIGPTRNVMAWHYSDGNLGFYDGNWRLSNYPAPADGDWHHLAYVQNATTNKGLIYVDGVAVATNLTYQPVSLIGTAVIGNHYTNTGYGINAYVDELKIYNTALSIEQIKQDMNTGSTLSVGTTTNEATDLSDGEGNPPIAEWKFDEMQGSTLSDTSGNNYNGTINGATWHAWCKQGGCLSFNGTNNYIDGFSTSNMNSFTIVAWVKTTSTDLINVTSGGNAGSYTSISGGQVRWYDGNSWRIGTSYVNDGNWHQVFYIFDNGAHYFGVDGNLEYNNNNGNGTYTSGNVTTIGVWSNKSTRFFNGFIDHVKIYDYARTPAQIAYDYNRGEPVAHWKMDECQGSTIHDSSDNSNHGTLTVTTTGGNTNGVGTCTTSTSAWGTGSSGKFGSSLYLDGSGDYISIPDPSVGSLTGPQGTISLWMKKAGTTEKVIAMNRSVYTGTEGFELYTNSGAAICFRGSGSTLFCTANNIFTSNVWTHVGVTYSNTSASIFVNGELKQTGPISTITDSTSPMYIGQYGSGGYNFDGQLDDIRLYNYALSEAQIQKVINEGSSLRFGD